MHLIPFGIYKCPNCNHQFQFCGEHPFIACPKCSFDMTHLQIILNNKVPGTTCEFCGKPAFVRQIPAPVPASVAYCDECADKCREAYWPTRDTAPSGVIETYYTLQFLFGPIVEDRLKPIQSLDDAKQKAIHRAQCYENNPILVLENDDMPVFMALNDSKWIPDQS